MGNPKAFLNIKRKEAGYRPVNERIHDYAEVEQTLANEDRREQASRCMECGVPFCHWACPTGNRQPEWQDLVYRGLWKEAYELLIETSDFPEFTGRVCPALCEKSCVLNLHDAPVTIRENEVAIIERAFAEGYVIPRPPSVRSGKKVAVIGSGPAGLAAAANLNRKGHIVTVYEKDEYVGGLLRLGIPDFKLGKQIVQRRINLMETEGISFRTGVNIGKDISAIDIMQRYDAVCLAIGSGVPRDLSIEGRDLKGVHFALDFLKQQNLINADADIDKSQRISAWGKRVLVIGGGDTGSDCVGTSIRQGAVSVTQIEIMPQPPEKHNPDTPWPAWPNVLKTSSSQEEGCHRRWCLDTIRFIGRDGRVTGAEVEKVTWEPVEQRRMKLVRTGEKEIIEADLVLISMGFLHPAHQGLVESLALDLDSRRNVAVDGTMRTSCDKVFAAGDAVTGASLVVRAIASGRAVAESIDQYLQKK